MKNFTKRPARPRRRAMTVTAAAALMVGGAVMGTTAVADESSGTAGPATVAASGEAGERADIGQERRLGVYQVGGVDDDSDRELTAAGVYVEERSGDNVVVSGTRRAIDRIRDLGYRVVEVVAPGPVEQTVGAQAAEEFPSGYEGYHTYDEMVAAIDQAVAGHPDLVEKFSIGQSYEGRELWAVRITSDVPVEGGKPEVLITHGQHAREHLTIEQGLHMMNVLTDGYGTDERITTILDGRQIVLVMNVNPDGSEFDYATGDFVGWRKNRQPNDSSQYVGTDLNRNWGYKWGCCGGSSGSPSSETYRGAAGFSAPETTAVRDYVVSRVVDGEQQITAHIDMHTFSELVLWPYGYTYDDVPADMTQDDHDIHVALGELMAGSNGYTPQQSSDLYITDGTIDDWAYAEYGITTFTFEMYPSSGGIDGFYPPDDVIDRETQRNDEALLTLFEYADCPSRIIDKPCAVGIG